MRVVVPATEEKAVVEVVVTSLGEVNMGGSGAGGGACDGDEGVRQKPSSGEGEGSGGAEVSGFTSRITASNANPVSSDRFSPSRLPLSLSLSPE